MSSPCLFMVAHVWHELHVQHIFLHDMSGSCWQAILSLVLSTASSRPVTLVVKLAMELLPWHHRRLDTST
eukprot:SAG11_NODE_185_length_13160_cov_9.118521_12_plen_70_part_00